MEPDKIRRPVRFGFSLKPNPRCLVCGLTMTRNDPGQIVKYHAACRKERNVLSRETRNQIP